METKREPAVETRLLGAAERFLERRDYSVRRNPAGWPQLIASSGGDVALVAVSARDAHAPLPAVDAQALADAVGAFDGRGRQVRGDMVTITVFSELRAMIRHHIGVARAGEE